MEKKAKKSFSLRKKIVIGGLGFLFFVLLISSFFGKKGLIEIYRAKRNSRALVQEIERLKEEKSRLEREIEELERNPKAVEKEAREKLGLVKPDEKVIIKKNN